MKKSRQNILIIVFAAAFAAFAVFGGATGAQTKPTARPTPTKSRTAVKTTPKPTAKPTVKPSATKTSTKPSTKPSTSPNKPKPAPKPTSTPATAIKETAQIIVSSASSRIRREANTSAETMQVAKLGTIFPVLEQNGNWYKIELAKTGADQTGWISKTVSQTLTNAKRAEIYQKIADKYLKTSPDFVTAAQLFDFLDSVAAEIKMPKAAADLELKRLLALQAALKKIPIDKKEQNPYAAFLKANEKSTVYSEPSGEFLVISGEFWDLREKYKALPISEEIAWRAAQNPLPGECEGYINCYLYLLRSTDGEYLNFYPGGKYSRQALTNISNLLDPIAADTGEQTIYVAPGDISDRADFNRYLTELRAIISKTSYIEKSRTLSLIKQIGDAHR